MFVVYVTNQQMHIYNYVHLCDHHQVLLKQEYK
jgi:hypothetical protein